MSVPAAGTPADPNAAPATPAAPADPNAPPATPDAGLMGGGTPATPAAGTPGASDPNATPAVFEWPAWADERFRSDRDTATGESKLILGEDGKPNWQRVAEKAVESWKEANTALSTQNASLGAPKAGEDGTVKYEFKVPEGLTGEDITMAETDSLWLAVQEVFAKHNLAQEVANDILKPFLEATALENASTAQEDISALRAAGVTEVEQNDVKQFFEGLVNTPAELNMIQQFAFEPEGFLTLRMLRDRILAKRTPDMGKGDGEAKTEKDRLNERRFDPRGDPSKPEYDEAFAKETEEIGKRLFPGMQGQ